MNLTEKKIRERFRSRGLKVTPQRTAIYKVLTETTKHPAADDIYQQVIRYFPMISPNTVYYTLSVLKEVGLVKEVNYWHDRSRFDANVAPHHHLICLSCRAIVDIEDQSLNHLARSSVIPLDFHLIHHQVEFYGYCRTCQKQSK